jgi:hypothetical protein
MPAGRTLIATGFEHKDPFAKTINLPKQEKQEDKIVMTLDMPVKEEKFAANSRLYLDTEAETKRLSAKRKNLDKRA